MADNNRNLSFEDDIRNLLITETRRTGGDPSFLFEVLETIIKERAWETLNDEGGKPVGSFVKLIEAPLPVGCGMSQKRLLQLLDLEHKHESKSQEWRDRMAQLRADIYQLLPKIGTQKDNQYMSAFDMSKANINEQTGGGNSKTYRIAVLKRDAPDIAEQVVSGELSAAAGIRKLRKRQGKPERERGAISFTNAQSALDTMAKYVSHDYLEELVILISEHLNSNDE